MNATAWIDPASARGIEADIAADSQKVLEHHARSFRIAARVLGTDQAADAAVCYAFCRAVDDAVDEAKTPDEAAAALNQLRDEARGRRPPRPLVTTWIRLALRRQIPLTAGWDLIDAMDTDLGPVRIADDAQLHRYAYGVAGTVGLMMCGILGAHLHARARAVDLGIAMQLTNIARDVAEDARRDRVYLPASRLRARGVAPDDVAAGTADPTRTFAVVTDLLDQAEFHYDRAFEGLRWMPWRSRLAVLLALVLSRGIGRAVRARGPAALSDRTVLPRWRLVGLAMAATASLLHPRVWGSAPSAPPDVECRTV